MRIWTIHPMYLDSKGLLALWRESLLAKNVLLGLTKGYKNHPQLIRFKNTKEPIKSINTYLYYIYLESLERNYSFDKSKINQIDKNIKIKVTSEQIDYEFQHLLKKLKLRNKKKYEFLEKTKSIKTNPIFIRKKGKIEKWEKLVKK